MNLKQAVLSVGDIFARILAREPDKRPVAILIAGRNANRRLNGGGPGESQLFQGALRECEGLERGPSQLSEDMEGQETGHASGLK